MKTKTAPEFVSSPRETQNDGNGSFIVRRSHGANEPLTERELAELKALAEMPDSAIDFSDIPELTEADFRSAVRRGLAYRAERQVTLFLSEVAASWVRENARKRANGINFALKQVVQHGRRAAYERSQGSTREIYDHGSIMFTHGLDLLSGRSVPGPKYDEVPEYSDEELKSLTTSPWPSLKAYNLTLLLDDEVYEWLESNAASHTIRINFALASLAYRSIVALNSSLSKAS